MYVSELSTNTGGYHPVTVGSVYEERYCVLRKVGWGHFSTVWLGWDLLSQTFVALKAGVGRYHFPSILKLMREGFNYSSITN